MSKQTEHLSLAHEYYEKGEFAEALKHYRNVGVNNLSDDDKVKVAKLLYQLDEKNEAIQIVSNIIEQSQALSAYLYRSHFHLQNGALDAAITDIDTALDYHKDDECKHVITLYVHKAMLLMKLKKQKEAEIALTDALAQHADSAVVEEELIDAVAVLYDEFDLAEEAIELLALVIAKTKAAYAHSVRANLLVQIDQDEEALYDLNEAVRLNPESSLYWYNRGLTHSYLGHYAEAIADFKETIKLEHDHSKFSTYYELARTYMKEGDYEEAVRIFQYLVDDSSQALPHYYMGLGLSLEEHGELEKAIISLEKGRELQLQLDAEKDQGLSAYIERANYNRRAFTNLRGFIRNQFDFYLPLGRMYRQLELWTYAEAMIKNAITVNSELSEPYYEWARLYRSQGKEDEALRVLLTLNEQFPSSPVAIYWLADVYFRLEQFEEALHCNDKLLEIEDDDEANFTQRGKILESLLHYHEAAEAYTQAITLQDSGEVRMKRAFTYFKTDGYEEALEDLQQAIKLDQDLEDEAEYYTLLGQVYAAMGNWKAAIMFSTAIRLNPNDTWLYAKLAEVYAAYHEVEEAEKTLIKALEIGHEQEEPYYELARFYRDQKNYTQVKQLLHDLHESFAPSPTSLFWLVEAHHRLEELAEAIKVSDELIALEADDELNFIQRGAVLVDVGEYEAAIEAYTEAMQLKEMADTYVKRSYASFCLEKFEDSLEDLNKAVELDPELKERDYYHIALGRVFYETELWDLANQAFAEALRIEPHNLWLYEQRANCFMKLDEYEAALGVCTTGLEIDATNLSLYWLRGLIHFTLENYDEALDDAQNYIKLNPENADAHYNLGLIYEKLEQYDDALAAFTDCLALNPQHDGSYLERAYIYYHHCFETEQAIADLLQWILSVDSRLTYEDKLNKIDELDGFNEQIVTEVKKRFKDFSIRDVTSILLN